MIKIETNKGKTTTTIYGNGSEVLADFSVINAAIIEGLIENANTVEERDIAIAACIQCFENAVKFVNDKFKLKDKTPNISKCLDELINLFENLENYVKR